ncbi:CBS domain-containing protein [Thermodesulfitimonas autotrophica]|uniref:CBS domain-containing protein n=1 Tax=Thermodesulfitimonas autotrophica TaxID=1894989 RepID=UPI002FE2DCE3
MPFERKVREIMVPLAEVPKVTLTDTVQDAVDILRRNASAGRQSLLVVDEDGEPVGILSARMLLRALTPEFLVVEKLSLPIFWQGFLSDRCREQAKKGVRELMRPLELITVEADAPLTKAVHIMVNQNVGTLPVMEKGRVIGLIQITEVFNEISTLILSEG